MSISFYKICENGRETAMFLIPDWFYVANLWCVKIIVTCVSVEMICFAQGTCVHILVISSGYQKAHDSGVDGRRRVAPNGKTRETLI